ncbi:MAG TPA: hypothetical protein VF597_00905 [Candidatus Saccharimonadales bacterium]|jgi:hypothetical protein
MKQHVQKLLEKEVDRKDFLKHVAIGVAAMTGVTAVAKTLTGYGVKSQASGFGSGAYGGPKN